MSILCIILVLYFQFTNFKDIAIIICAIPLGLIGVCLSLYIFESNWSINSLLGLILLAGISVNNSIIFLSFYNQNNNIIKSKFNNIIETAKTRLRPILVTSLTTILAMLPISFGWGEGGQVLQPLGIAVSGGMIFSTFLMLLVIPCVIWEWKND